MWFYFDYFRLFGCVSVLGITAKSNLEGASGDHPVQLSLESMTLD